MTVTTPTISDAEVDAQFAEIVDYGLARTLAERPLQPTLREAATHLILPDGVARTLWPRIHYRLTVMGVQLDRWQEGFCKAALGIGADNMWACGVDGVCASIPRQVGKTFLISCLLIALAIEFPGFKAVWTSHHGRTTTNTFRAVQAIVRRPEVKPFLKPGGRTNGIRTGNNEEEIEFGNGSIIMFGARERGFGRGMDAVDAMVFDEAQILGIKALEDMVPAANQAKNPHGGLLFFIGTPPRPVDDGAAFTAKRAAALSGDAREGMWVEICGDEDLDDPYSPKQYRLANPSYPRRTTPTAMKRMRKNLPDVGAWMREALGIWPKDVIERVLPDWEDQVGVGPGKDARPDGFGVDMSRNGHLSVSAAWNLPDGGLFVAEVLATRSMEKAAAFIDDKAGARDPILIDEHSPARALMPLLRKRRLRGAKTARIGDMIAACALTEAGIAEHTLTHAGQDVLDQARRGATKRYIKTSAGGWVWEALDDDVPLRALNAVSLAVLGASQTMTTTSSGREAIAM